MPAQLRPPVDGTFVRIPIHDQRPRSFSPLSVVATNPANPEPRSGWSARSEGRTNDLDRLRSLILAAGSIASCQETATTVTECDFVRNYSSS